MLIKTGRCSECHTGHRKRYKGAEYATMSRVLFGDEEAHTQEGELVAKNEKVSSTRFH